LAQALTEGGFVECFNSSFVRAFGLTLIAALGITACAGGSSSAPTGGAVPSWLSAATGSGSGGSSKYISHVVVVIQENRSFDDLFATFPGADGAAGGMEKLPSGDQYVPLQEVGLDSPCDWGHSRNGYLEDWDNGKMDGFNLEGASSKCPGKAGTKVYQYVNPSQIEPYWQLAQQYVLADQMFQTQGSGSFTAHQDLIAGGTILNESQTQSLVDFPSAQPWGCDAHAGTVTSLLVSHPPRKLKLKYHKGPFPCLSYATMRDLLDAGSVSWTYYSPPEPNGPGALWNAFDAIAAVRKGPEWKTNIRNSTQIFSDITQGNLANVAWVVPDDDNSDHPGVKKDYGPSWVASVVNAIGESSYWDSTAIVIVWDDWGGFYDNAPPPFIDQWGGLGFRVPMIVVSPYAREGASGPGLVEHEQYEFGSILKFIENTWGLGQLGTTDTRATSIIDCFDFTQQPRQFQEIGSSHSIDFFKHQKPSYLPVDSE
jgi:phospholipase C